MAETVWVGSWKRGRGEARKGLPGFGGLKGLVRGGSNGQYGVATCAEGEAYRE